MKTKMKLAVSAFLLCIGLSVLFGTNAQAASFDPAYYAARYPDVVQALGTDSQVLYNHYITYGMKEGRTPYEGAKGGEAVDGILSTKAADSPFVPLKKLANYKSLKKKMTDAEFEAAYQQALALVTPLANRSREEQLQGIQQAIHTMFDSGRVVYSTSETHYNDPYGYFVKGVGSCCRVCESNRLNGAVVQDEHVVGTEISG